MLKVTLQTITILRLFPHNIQNRINQLSPLRVMPFGPVIPGTRLPKHEVIRPENLSVRTGPDAVHCTGLEVQEHGPRDVPATRGLVEVHIDTFQLEIGGEVFGGLVLAVVLDAVLVAGHFPEFGADLVAALAGLDVEDFSHCFSSVLIGLALVCREIKW